MVDPQREKVASARLQMWPCSHGVRLTVQDVSKALSTEQLLQTSHFILQVTHQLVVGVLVDDGVALDVLGSVGVAGKKTGVVKGFCRRRRGSHENDLPNGP